MKYLGGNKEIIFFAVYEYCLFNNKDKLSILI